MRSRFLGHLSHLFLGEGGGHLSIIIMYLSLVFHFPFVLKPIYLYIGISVMLVTKVTLDTSFGERGLGWGRHVYIIMLTYVYVSSIFKPEPKYTYICRWSPKSPLFRPRHLNTSK